MTIRTTILLLFTANLLTAQDFQAEFRKHSKTGDTTRQLQTLTAWEAAKPGDAELYVSYFNFYFTQSRRELIGLTTDKPEGEGMALKDSLGNTTGYLGSQILYDHIVLQKGFDKINEGILKFPDRLDMRFGKVYVCGQIKDWVEFTAEIIRAVQYSTKNNNLWLWSNNESKQDGKDFFLSTLQDYQVQLYNTGNDSLLINMQKIANMVLKYYPDHIESLSNLSVTYLLTGDYDKGIETLLRAEKINPKDPVVLANIAHAYNSKGDKKNAIAYYKKVMKHGNAETRQYAEEQIQKLKD